MRTKKKTVEQKKTETARNLWSQSNNGVKITRYNTWVKFKLVAQFLARNAFVRTNRPAINDMMFVRLSVCLSVWDGRALWSYGAV